MSDLELRFGSMAKTQFRGPHSRRDEKLKGGNVIKGFRLEPAAADALIKYARENFCDGRGVCNLTSAARILLRTRLGWPKSTAGDGEQLSEATRGMAMERRLVGSIKAFAEKSNLGFVPRRAASAARGARNVVGGVVPARAALRSDRRWRAARSWRRSRCCQRSPCSYVSAKS